MALLLDSKGTILKVRRNPMSITFEKGANIARYIEEQSMMRLIDALETVRHKGYSMGTDVIFTAQDDSLHARLLMMRDGEAIACMTLGEDEAMLSTINEMLKINLEQQNFIRSHFENRNEPSKGQSVEEISRLNSELINTHRKLAQKNAELERLNAKLDHLSRTDDLTGAYNRRAFFKDLHKINAQSDVRLIMTDFNNFKLVNDTFGHETGDETLKTFATMLKDCLDEHGGRLYRIGGDEFATVLETSADFDASQCLNTIQEKLSRVHRKLSVAYGETTIRKEDDIGERINEADKKMYQNKYQQKTRNAE